MATKKRIEPVGYWRKWWKLYSTWLAAAGAALQIYSVEAPQHALEAWLWLPPDLKSLIPEEWARYFSYVLLFASFISRFIRQPKLTKEVKQDGHF